MDETTYKILMGTSAFIVAMLGSMLATTTIPPECGLEKLRKARNILVPSYFVLAFSAWYAALRVMTIVLNLPVHFSLHRFRLFFLPCPCWFSYVRVKSDGA